MPNPFHPPIDLKETFQEAMSQYILSIDHHNIGGTPYIIIKNGIYCWEYKFEGNTAILVSKQDTRPRS